MSNQYLKLRRSGVPGKIPSTSSIDYGEIALNTYDGVAYMKKSGSSGEEVVVIGSSTGSFTGDFTGTFTGSLQGTASYAPNVYNTDDALTGNRVIDIGNYELDIASGSYKNLEIQNINDTGSVVIRNSLYISGAPSGSILSNEYLSGSIKFPQLTIEAVYPSEPSDRFQIKAGGYGSNTWFGFEAMQNVIRPGTQNDAFGFRALQNLTTGVNNTAFGGWALGDTTTGTRNVAVGLDAMWRNVIGSRNTAIGNLAGMDNISGSRNIYIGDEAGRGILSGSNNIIIGRQVGLPAGLSNNIIISVGAGTTRARSFETGNWLFQNGGVFVDSGFFFDVNGTTRLQNTLTVSAGGANITGALTAPNITGSLFGTASWAQNSLTASTSENVVGASNQLAFFDSANSVTSSANLRFTNNNVSLTGSLTIRSSGTEAINLGTSATGLDQPVDIRLATGNARGIRIYASDNELTVTPNGAGFQFFSNNSANFPGQVYFDSAANNNAAIILRTSQTGQIIQERMRITSAGNVLIGTPTDSGFKLDVNGTTRLQNTLTVSAGGANITGALNAPTITGSLYGTASWADNALTASHVNTLNQNVTVVGNQTISGSLTVRDNLIVLGSASVTYISESTLNIGTNLITVNAFSPSIRFGGLAVIDSGSSPLHSGSFLFDSLKDQFIFVHQTTPITSSVFLLGPETYNDQGNEIYLTANRIPKGTGIEHLNDSNISDDGSVVSINSNTQITGSLAVSAGITTSNSMSLVDINDVAHTVLTYTEGGGGRQGKILLRDTNSPANYVEFTTAEIYRFTGGNTYRAFYPDGVGRLVLKVNGISADSSGDITFPTGSFATTGSNTFNGNQIISGSLVVTALTAGTGSGDVVMYNTASGQFFFTSSAAIGGGGGNASNDNFQQIFLLMGG